MRYMSGWRRRSNANVSWLDAQERWRYERCRFPQHRHEYLVAHALLRSCLSRYGEQPPQDWRFSTNAYGRPEIQVEQGAPPRRFNLSHTEGLVACAITRAAEVGIDVEHGGQPVRAGDLAAIAVANFAPVELAELARLTGIAWRHRFFDVWTLKEAYIKAQGLGGAENYLGNRP
ncbi:4'-phosphopantetheinyl transferase HetI [Halomicronema hongdechloris C2206]|uniref:4'-phosphopantetheinyl transferase HetI n=1 Tax=Halomicronema hongdechloris C2206 TaxID=1641165 RepID=A0A1Z3HH29_9CYAN|nr:4'-phosphopantetheinyl transferase superfamily protein [Halomicronema hongdechloris]ASC69573.1 4'-phosphopantetheinyl transferase HetI [Halomicronema hongdechloris C2206]